MEKILGFRNLQENLENACCFCITIPFAALGFLLLVGLLICTLISENLGLEKSRSVSNLRKISGPGNLDFFLGLHLEKKLCLYYKSEKNPGDRFAGLQDLKFFLGLK